MLCTCLSLILGWGSVGLYATCQYNFNCDYILRHNEETLLMKFLLILDSFDVYDKRLLYLLMFWSKVPLCMEAPIYITGDPVLQRLNVSFYNIVYALHWSAEAIACVFCEICKRWENRFAGLKFSDKLSTHFSSVI